MKKRKFSIKLKGCRKEAILKRTTISLKIGFTVYGIVPSVEKKAQFSKVLPQVRKRIQSQKKYSRRKAYKSGGGGDAADL